MQGKRLENPVRTRCATPVLALTKAALPSCRYDCGRSAKTARSTLCSVCFMKKAKSSGARSSGNPKAKGSVGNVGSPNGNPGNAGNPNGNRGNAGNPNGNRGNAGNPTAKGSVGNAGKLNGNPGNAGKLNGNPGNAGNMNADHAEMAKRSNLKQSARIALVVKKHWLDKILTCEKDWEIRGCSTARRGWIHFAESEAGGLLVGRARLMDCIRIPRATFESNFCRHRVANVADVPYKNIFAWVFQDPERFAKPFFYKHSHGAVIWVKTSNKRGRAAHERY